MTGQEFSEVDFDLLADYVGGALDGMPGEAVVARRIAKEPAWAEAHAALAEATGSVRASLVSLGTSAEPMPAEVADRIATALVQAPHRPALSVVPDDADGPPRTAPRARRRLPAWAAPVAIAAGVAALAGLGLSQASNLGDSEDGASNSAEAPAGASGLSEAGPGIAADAAGVLVTQSGQNYRALAEAQPPASPFMASSERATTGKDGDRNTAQSAATALGRLRDDPAALDACIRAVAEAHPLEVTSVQAVDLASFEGSPAAILFFTDSSGARWAWASGPECGQAGRGADTRGSSKIG